MNCICSHHPMRDNFTEIVSVIQRLFKIAYLKLTIVPLGNASFGFMLKLTGNYKRRLLLLVFSKQGRRKEILVWVKMMISRNWTISLILVKSSYSTALSSLFFWVCACLQTIYSTCSSSFSRGCPTFFPEKWLIPDFYFLTLTNVY